MATLAEFVARYDGQYVQAPGGIGGQCMDLASLWVLELGMPRLDQAAAKDVIAYPPAGFDVIGAGEPQAGDLVVWGELVGPYGHIAVALYPWYGGFTSFDQNWPIDSPCHSQSHVYSGVLGWLRKHEDPPPPPEVNEMDPFDLVAGELKVISGIPLDDKYVNVAASAAAAGAGAQASDQSVYVGIGRDDGSGTAQGSRQLIARGNNNPPGIGPRNSYVKLTDLVPIPPGDPHYLLLWNQSPSGKATITVHK